MKTNPDGSIEFQKGRRIYKFEKDNFKKHLVKRPKLGYQRFLEEIEQTILEPDCITEGPRARNQENFYRVTSYQDSRDARYVTYWKIPVFYRNRNLAIIATAFDTTSPNDYAINPLEKIKWKKQSSQI